MTKYKSITIKTVQGLGDIVWCLQRLYPYFEQVHIRIMMIKDEPLQKRSLPLFRSFFPDFVKSIEMVPCTPEEYNEVYKSDFYVTDILQEYKENEWAAQEKIYTFASNHQLELGERIEFLDPNLTIQETLPFSSKKAVTKFEGYATVYVSGTKMNIKSWSITDWAEYVSGVMHKFNIDLPIILTGAEFDTGTLSSLSMLLNMKGLTTDYYIGGDPQQTIDFLRRSEFFIGYQSGLNILCDQLDVPQIMLYFDFLKELRTSWPKKKNLKNGSHQVFGFESSWKEVLEQTNNILFKRSYE